MARPSEYDIDLCNEICDRVKLGEHIHNRLESDDRYPSKQTWYNWIGKHKELFDIYYACRKDKAESKEREMLDIMHDLRLGKLDPHTGKVLIDANKWLMSVYNSKLFGQKAEISGAEDVSGISIVIHKKDAE